MSWFRVDDAAAFHRKTLAAGNEAFGAWVRMGAHASGQYTNGFVDASAALLIAGRQKHLDRLVEVGFLERTEGGYQIHDYLDYNPRSEDVRARQDAISEARRAAGRVGGRHSGEARRKQVASKQPEADAKQNEANGKQTAKQTGSKTEAPSHPIPEETSTTSLRAHDGDLPGPEKFTDPWTVAQFLRERSGGRISLTLLGSNDRDLLAALRQLAAQDWGFADLAAWAAASRVGADGWEGEYALGLLLGKPDADGTRPCRGLAKCLETSRSWARVAAAREAEKARQIAAHEAAEKAPSRGLHPLLKKLAGGAQ